MNQKPRPPPCFLNVFVFSFFPSMAVLARFLRVRRAIITPVLLVTNALIVSCAKHSKRYSAKKLSRKQRASHVAERFQSPGSVGRGGSNMHESQHERGRQTPGRVHIFIGIRVTPPFTRSPQVEKGLRRHQVVHYQASITVLENGRPFPPQEPQQR